MSTVQSTTSPEVMRERKLRESTHSSWSHMRERCLNRKYRHYHLWGGRGITICKEWATFAGFLRDMGLKPDVKGWTIERIDNNGNYEPGNCRWVTRSEQGKNTRRVHRYTHQGETMSITAWAIRLGFKPHTLRKRLVVEGLSFEEAITRPVTISGKDVLVTFRGKTATMKQHATDVGFNYEAVCYRIRIAKWPIDRALTEPVHIGKNQYHERDKQSPEVCRT